MKKILFLTVILFAASIHLSAQNPTPKEITVAGKVNFLNPEKNAHFNKVWLTKGSGGDTKLIDSVNISKDGSWHFTIKSDVPSFYTLDIAKWDRATVYSDSDAVINTRGYDTAKIKMKNPPYIFVQGSDANNFINLVESDIYLNYQNMIAVGQEMYYAGQSKDSSWIKYLKEKDPYDQLNNDFRERINVLIRAYEEKPVVIYGLRMLNWEKNQDFILPILNNLNTKYPWFSDASQFRNEMEKKIAQAKLLKPGMPVPEISYPDEKGLFHNFNEYKGKILLVDFWASWCGPCRAAVPKVKELYNKYKTEGFDVLSISIDDSKSAWLKALNEEKMPWKQLLSPDKNITMEKFLFSGIPTLYLIDQSGKIITSFTGFTPEAQEKVKSLFDKK